MIHTGSRDVGFYVGRRWMDWPGSNGRKASSTLSMVCMA
jgi:hypothetical protein